MPQVATNDGFVRGLSPSSNSVLHSISLCSKIFLNYLINLSKSENVKQNPKLINNKYIIKQACCCAWLKFLSIYTQYEYFSNLCTNLNNMLLDVVITVQRQNGRI